MVMRELHRDRAARFGVPDDAGHWRLFLCRKCKDVFQAHQHIGPKGMPGKPPEGGGKGGGGGARIKSGEHEEPQGE